MNKPTDNSLIQPAYWPWQQPLLEQIQSLKQQARLPHAILIEARSEQVGAPFIWHLAMLALCKNSHNFEPCRQCQSCELMLSNTYPDFSFVSLERDEKTKKINKNIKIEQIRNLKHEVYLTRRYDNLKIVTVYPAEKMSIAGANSLLKTLEEPASHSLILLVTHNKGKVPVTVRSRCQVLTLDHPPTEAALSWLQQQGMTEQESAQYLEYATGDPLLALQLQSSGYADLVKQFKTQFGLYIKNEVDVIKLCSGLVTLEPGLVRRLIKMVLRAYSFQFCGLSKKANPENEMDKIAGQKILTLAIQVERQLMVEDNNLNLQLQLEDVLISLKRIILRSTD
ncbi:MAG: DNA polymerase III delta' subunit [Gammaproteobacteria bacterium]|jgi:DNA polymerase III delta' subunit